MKPLKITNQPKLRKLYAIANGEENNDKLLDNEILDSAEEMEYSFEKETLRDVLITDMLPALENFSLS